MKVSIVIPSWNGWHVLKKCLECLEKQTFKDFETIVVDNGSSDETRLMLAQKYYHVKAILLDKNYGFSVAVNHGIKKASADLVVLLNNDTEPTENWLESLTDAAERYPEFSIFASRVLVRSKPNVIDTVGDGFTIAGFGYKIGWMQNNNSEFDVSKEVFGASACAALYRKKVFLTIGYFDEDFFAFAEDLDLSFRARLAGFKCRYVPDAVVFHHVRSTAPPDKTREWYYRNLIWLIFKNFPTSLLIIYSPHIILNWTLVGFRSILQGWFKIFLHSTIKGLMGIPLMVEKRRYIQRKREISVNELRKLLTGNWFQIHWRFSKIARRIRTFLNN